MSTERLVPGEPSPAPDVTVVIPSFGRPALVRRAVANVIAQVGVVVEILVVDDANEPPLAVAIAGLVVQVPSVLRVIRMPERSGVALSRNRGVAEARGRLVAFLDDDDLWAPDKLARQVALLDASRRRWTWCGGYCLDIELQVRWTTIPDETLGTAATLGLGNLVGTPSGVMAERSLLRETGGFDAAFSVMADWDCWLRLAAAAPGIPLPEALIGYVTHHDSMHRQDLAATIRELRILQAKHASTVPISGHGVWRWLGDSARDAGRRALAVGIYLWVGIRWLDPRTLAAAAAVLLPFLRAPLPRAKPAPVPAWVARWRTAHVVAPPEPPPLTERS